MALAMVRLQLRNGAGFRALTLLRAVRLWSPSDRLLRELLEGHRSTLARFGLSSPDMLLFELHELRGGNFELPCDMAVCVET